LGFLEKGEIDDQTKSTVKETNPDCLFPIIGLYQTKLFQPINGHSVRRKDIWKGQFIK